MPTKCWSNKQNNKCINKTNKYTNKCINKHMYEHTISYKLCDRHAASVQMPNKTDETNKRGADNHWGGETSISSILEVRRKIRCCCYVCVMFVYYTLCTPAADSHPPPPLHWVPSAFPLCPQSANQGSVKCPSSWWDAFRCFSQDKKDLHTRKVHRIVTKFPPNKTALIKSLEWRTVCL